MSELKPCPFCGSDKLSSAINGCFEPSIACDNCGAYGPNEVTKNDAVNMWNLRRPEVERVGKMAKTNAQLEARIAELEAASRWISVEERLPKTCGCYLTLADDWVEQDYFNLEGKWLSGSNVTHWMPLPQTPEAQS